MSVARALPLTELYSDKSQRLVERVSGGSRKKFADIAGCWEAWVQGFKDGRGNFTLHPHSLLPYVVTEAELERRIARRDAADAAFIAAAAAAANANAPPAAPAAATANAAAASTEEANAGPDAVPPASTWPPTPSTTATPVTTPSAAAPTPDSGSADGHWYVVIRGKRPAIYNNR